ncbi:MAG: hypothetical protein UU23_C0003G0010 [Candidatus Curtissbacteria bacterium GW2011_GWA1_40_9]|uniref:Uncharacterized protein n=1 Tax=Candidatus Curtissbacteria bacterium GW2011_GWA1_40_9 TaxID=1618408 RepID=A0A0G0WRY0_9BACT|nr:MAG: hypothetical protein UU23_C0003G0010 [Candidatus Curtissbacteria bacterium GW2011_GWA1_40_9]
MPKGIEAGTFQAQIIAIDITGLSAEELISFIRQMSNAYVGIDLETCTFLFRPEEAKRVLEDFDAQDLTDIYKELKERRVGFRVVRIGNSYPHEELADRENKAVIIKDYSTGTLHVYNEFGRPEGIIPAESAPVAYSASRFKTVLERPLVFLIREVGDFERILFCNAELLCD